MTEALAIVQLISTGLQLLVKAWEDADADPVKARINLTSIAARMEADRADLDRRADEKYGPVE